MNEPEFTRGPWVIQERDLVHGEHEVLVKPSICRDAPTWIAEVSESDNQLANATLIKLAPEFAEALRELHDFCGKPASYCDEERYNTAMQTAARLMNQVGV